LCKRRYDFIQERATAGPSVAAAGIAPYGVRAEPGIFDKDGENGIKSEKENPSFKMTVNETCRDGGRLQIRDRQRRKTTPRLKRAVQIENRLGEKMVVWHNLLCSCSSE
jgi:hypothetical protein